MSADEALHPILFQGRSPLRYNRAANVERFGVVNPGAELPNEPVLRPHWDEAKVQEQDYWHSQVTIGRGKSGRPLKQRKTITNPGAASPGTVSFADVTPMGEDVYIHYVHTRQDQKGRGHASRLVEHVAQQYPGTIDFGRVMSPSVWRMKERLEQQGRQTRGRPDF
jgi:hypothetical protein